MKKTFQQFISENPHFADVQGLREASDHGAYFRTALEKAWNAGRDSMIEPNMGSSNESPHYTSEPTRHADLSAAERPGIDKRLGATGEAVE